MSVLKISSEKHGPYCQLKLLGLLDIMDIVTVLSDLVNKSQIWGREENAEQRAFFFKKSAGAASWRPGVSCVKLNCKLFDG